MPTVLFLNGFRLHVTKANGDGKIWLEPTVKIAYLHGFTNAQQNDILDIVLINYELLKNEWHEFFNQ